MQKPCEVRLETYLAADNPFDVVSRPDVCDSCSEKDCFHRHATYWRYVEKKHVRVARFLCKLCGVTVSMLPMFVLPYRNQLLDTVERYFLAAPEERTQMGNGDVLRQYWRQWVGHFSSIQQDTGWPPERPLQGEPKAYWRQLGKAGGSMAKAQKHLIGGFGSFGVGAPRGQA